MQSAANQAKAFHDDGFLVVRQLFSPERIQQVVEQADKLAGDTEIIASNNMRCRFQARQSDGSMQLEAIDPITDLLPAALEVARDEALSQILAAIFLAKPCLFKDKLIFKPRGCRGYALHQDYIHWPFFPKSFTTVVVALEEAHRENGCIEVFPRMHHSGCLSKLDGDFHDLSPTLVEGKDSVFLELQPGDVAIFGCFLPHRSAANLTSSFRRQLYLSFNAANDGGDQRSMHYRDFHRWIKKRYGAFGSAQLWFK